MHDTVYLDTLDGLEFEDLCEQMFKNLGYAVENIVGVGDGGRDLILHSVDDEKIIVECKHQPNSTVGRPVVQKLHSAVISSHAKKGILITSGKFSKEAIEHAELLTSQGITMELVDFLNFVALAVKAKINISTSMSDTIVYSFPIANDTELKRKFQNIFEKLQSWPQSAYEIAQLELSQIVLVAHYKIKFSVKQDFSTSVGVIHSIHKNDLILILDAANGLQLGEETISFLTSSVLINSEDVVQLSSVTSRTDFNLDQTSLIEHAKRQIIHDYSKTIKYTGKNNVTYYKNCKPGKRNISIHDVKHVYIPHCKVVFKFKNTKYNCTILQNDTQISILSTDVYQCNLCDEKIKEKSLLCNNCGSIVHGPKLFNSHGFVCKNCEKTICKKCRYQKKQFLLFKKNLCESCYMK